MFTLQSVPPDGANGLAGLHIDNLVRGCGRVGRTVASHVAVGYIGLRLQRCHAIS